MDTQSLARIQLRVSRGIRLHRERAHEIERLDTTSPVYRVPSCSGNGEYIVDTGLAFCSCPDHPRAKAAGSEARCKHFYAAMIYRAKRSGFARASLAKPAAFTEVAA